MGTAKQKSSGWQPADKRCTWHQREARTIAAQTAEARQNCTRLGLWRACPARHCRRVRGCAANNPRACMEQRRPNVAAKAAPNAAAAAANPAPRFALSAKEAAAAIAASIAGIVEP